jgi:uncharacterized membrane protein
MKRLLPLALIFVALWLSGPVLLSNGQDEPTPVPPPAPVPESEKVLYINIYTDGTWDYAPLPEGTPTPDEFTPAPSSTPTPMPSPTPTSTPLPLCGGLTTADTLNGRDAPRGAVTAQFTKGTAVGISGGQWYNQAGTWELWYKATANGKTVWVLSTYVQLNTGAVCSFPAKPVTSKLGLHLTVGANAGVVYAALPRIGLLKCTTGTEGICIGAKQQRPDLLILYRVTTPDCPTGWGNGNGTAVADAWWNTKYNQWRAAGMIGVADFTEGVNECGFGGSAWERAFWIRMMENANLAGVCILLFSDSYGTPSILEFQSRAPILDYALAHPCASGRVHSIAMHSYEGVQSGDWKWGRYRLFMDALGDKYLQVPIVFSEYAYNTGNPPTDCTALWADWSQASKVFNADPQVLGVNYFNTSPIGGWLDVSPCF